MTNITPDHFGFSARLIESAKHLLPACHSKADAGRAVLYYSYLSCELSLKALLESAGFSLKDLAQCSHNFFDLLTLVSLCKIPTPNGKSRRATSILAVQADSCNANSTIGNLLDKLPYSNSYPSGIRYKNKFSNYDPELMVKCAEKVQCWCVKHSQNIQCPQNGGAQFTLGSIYNEGRAGVSKNERKAKLWWKRAEKLGHNKAKSKLAGN